MRFLQVLSNQIYTPFPNKLRPWSLGAMWHWVGGCGHQNRSGRNRNTGILWTHSTCHHQHLSIERVSKWRPQQTKVFLLLTKDEVACPPRVNHPVSGIIQGIIELQDIPNQGISTLGTKRKKGLYLNKKMKGIPILLSCPKEASA